MGKIAAGHASLKSLWLNQTFLQFNILYVYAVIFNFHRINSVMRISEFKLGSLKLYAYLKPKRTIILT